VSTTEVPSQSLLDRPKRADARRNYEKVLAAAREAFSETGAATSLEEIARRAGVGIGTLYRHFPTRQALLEAAYVDEVEAVCRDAAELEGGDPWDALVAWLHRVAAYFVTKQALAQELMNFIDRDAPLFAGCRDSLFSAGDPLLKRAQEAQAVRGDIEFWDLIQMVGGITKIPGGDPQQVEHILGIALDGLRYRAPGG
jgi:AcrR family transcriptional regulator